MITKTIDFLPLTSKNAVIIREDHDIKYKLKNKIKSKIKNSDVMVLKKKHLVWQLLVTNILKNIKKIYQY